MADLHPERVIETERLILEPYHPSQAEALNDLNADPEVMRYIGGPETLEETRAAIARVQARWERYGFSWWAVRLRESGDIIGAACLQHLAHEEGAPLEIGWRLKPEYHGKGFATEAGQAAADFAFGPVGVDHIVAVAHRDNTASQRVMERLGMTYRGIEVHYGEPCAVYELQKTERT